MMYRVNAGHIPPSHWTQDPVEGGGRILGEVCHFIDLMQFMCGSDPVQTSALCIDTDNREETARDNVVINLKFADGSVGSIGYFAAGPPGMSKEQMEIFGAGRAAVIHNFQKVSLYTGGKAKQGRSSSKGHREEILAFLEGVGSGVPPIPAESQIATTLATLKVLDSLAGGTVETIDLRDLDRYAT